METDRTATIDTGAGRLHVSIRGAGPPAMLWHSMFVDLRQWSRIVDDLATVRTVVMVDGPGHGRSGPPPADVGFAHCADAAATVLDDLGLTDVDWVGNAWGGHCGYVFAATHPDRCRSLAAIAAPVTRVFPPARAAAVAEAIPRGSAVTVPGAGHLPPLERPTEVVRALRSLWGAPPASAV